MLLSAAQLLVIRSQSDLVTDSSPYLSLIPRLLSLTRSSYIVSSLCADGRGKSRVFVLEYRVSVSAKSVSQASCVNSIFRQFLLREHTLGSLVSGKCRDGMRISVFFYCSFVIMFVIIFFVKRAWDV